MLLSLLGFLAFLGFFSGVGSLTLRYCAPSIRWSLPNLLVFLAGAWAGSAITLLGWHWVSGRTEGLFVAAAIGGTFGGLATAALWLGITKR